MKFLAALALLPLVLAAPSDDHTLEKRLDTKNYCGQYDSTVAGQYTLYINQWGKDGATSGSDCAQLTSQSGTTIAWKNPWSWTGGDGIKSYTNANLNVGLNKQLFAISTIPSNVAWTYSTTKGIVANVAYDLFSSSTPSGKNEYEFMIWLANFNANPISYKWNAQGQPVPIATNLSLAGHTWNVYHGSNGANVVYSFLPTSGTVPSLNADLNLFLKYLTSKQGLPTQQYLTTLQLGTEATLGAATFTVSSFSASIN